MFENGSYLRRRKRFKLLTKPSSEINKTTNSTTPVKNHPNKCSFFIDNLLANETNTSCPSSSSSSPPSEVNSTFQHLLYSTDLDLVRKLTLLNDIHTQQQQVYW